MTSNPRFGAKMLMAYATIADVLKLLLPVNTEPSGHIRANGGEASGGGRRRRKRGYPREQPWLFLPNCFSKTGQKKRSGEPPLKMCLEECEGASDMTLGGVGRTRVGGKWDRDS